MGQKIALIIGNSEYKDERISRLMTPEANALGLADVLQAKTIGNFNEVVTLTNKSNFVVRRAISKLFADKNKDDLLLLYFSGYGIRDEIGQLHLAMIDTELDMLSTTAISATFIKEEMARSRSRRQLIIVDCSFSGAFVETRLR